MARVFAYGSLTGLGGRRARLRGVRRTWGVAMDNRVAIPGYKRWLDPRTGEPPPVHVAFLDLVRDPGGVVEGVLLDVDASALEVLDARERNYDRVEVQPGVFTYRGSAAGRGRLAEGRAAGTVVVARSYLELTTAGPPDLPVVDLVRQDL